MFEIKEAVNIVLVGAGQLGSRHLQALANLDRPANITVIDPSENSLRLAKERFEAVTTHGNHHQIHKLNLHRNLEDAPCKSFDFGIVACTANFRRQAVQELTDKCLVRNLLLEKVLFQAPRDYSIVSEILTNKKIPTWVNLAQRQWPFFQNLKNVLPEPRDLTIIVSGSNWGLGCNAIHNADLLPFLSGDHELSFTAELDEGESGGFLESKRAGFLEFTGFLSCRDRHNNRVIQQSFKVEEAPFTFEVLGPNLRQIWDVLKGKALVSNAQENWNWHEIEMRAPYQSQLTHIVVQEILDFGKCVLPTYSESAELHLKMLEVFMKHLKKNGYSEEFCPIT